MKKSAEFALQFLVIGLVLAYPQDAVAGKKSSNFFANVGRALGGDREALKKVVGSDAATVVAAIGGDEASQAKLKDDWNNAKKKIDALVVKFKILMADEEEAAAKSAAAGAGKTVDDKEEKPVASAGAAAPTEEITQAALAGLNTRLAALEAQFAEEMARRAGLRAALPVPVASAAAGAGVAADDKELSPKATVGAAAPHAELLAVQAAQLASLSHPSAAGTESDPAELSSMAAPTPRVSGATLPDLAADRTS